MKLKKPCELISPLRCTNKINNINMKPSIFLKSAFFSALFFFVLTVLSCNCDGSILTAHTWVLEKYGPKGSLLDAIDPATTTPPGLGEVTLLFSNNQVSGKDGCNAYNGQYSLNNCTLGVTGLQVTLMHCGQPIMAQAGAYSAILKDVKTFRWKNDRLELCTEDDRILIFRKK